MRKLALLFVLFVAVQLSACTPRPEESPTGDSVRSEVITDIPNQDSLASAGRQADPTRENYILPMDTVHVGYDGEMAVLTVGGPLGDGCQRFEFIDSVKDGSTLRLTFWASRPKAKDAMCTQQMQFVERELRVPQSAYTRLSVDQPHGKPPLERSLSEQ